MTLRLALGISYDGRPWQGWQTQPHGLTLQDCLESSIESFTACHHPTTCAGRTDTGVHATAQVVHFDTDIDRPMESWVRGLNSKLPDSISVQWGQVVPDSFHARFSARARSYTYLVLNSRVRQPLWAGRAGWVFRSLDFEAMKLAASSLIGEHDFSSFRSSQCQAKSPVRTMTRLDVTKSGDLIIFHLQANAFLHHMVRNIVGALLQIGQGRQPVDYIVHTLNARDRTLAAPTFAPDGLYLTDVHYPDITLPKSRKLPFAS
ncbi:tRNA pseudouridine38-40 synthase [Jezberella montanilacus]|uniref:tRNA pseudouridine synthase A n=1 Tax=Jezberella montanilacus TaxID=323426 RepID=A0A2T0XCE4_9BURK|nr:tRNA pseudouridine(38-40) synthase TruA [Jezberella montanilacus]PRY96610.1 tRNA pseudouridine38-40 synthase [Jezberella montanilacus]